MKPYFERDGITIYHGDCLDVLPTLGPVDHVITDPPYGVDVYQRMRGNDSKGGNRRHKIRNGGALTVMKAGAIGDLGDLVDPVASEIVRLARRWAVVFSDAESNHLWRQALVEHGMRHMRQGIWLKLDAMPQMTGDRPGVGHEPCEIAHAVGASRWNRGGHLGVWKHYIERGNDRPEHPCPKPLLLMREMVLDFTDPGETILDPFAGSGTTGRAALDLGRKAILIEREEKWCEVAAKRMSQAVLL